MKDDTETLLRWQSVGGGALPFNARAKRTRTSESPTGTKKIAKICNKKLTLVDDFRTFLLKLVA